MNLVRCSSLVGTARHGPQSLAGLVDLAGIDRREHLSNVALEFRLCGTVALAVAEILIVSLLGAGRVWHAGYYPLKIR